MANLTAEERAKLRKERAEGAARRRRLGPSLDESDFLWVGDLANDKELSDEARAQFERHSLSPEQLLSQVFLAIVLANPSNRRKASPEARVEQAVTSLLGTGSRKRGAKRRLGDEGIILNAAERLFRRELGFDGLDDSERAIFRDALVASGDTHPTEDRIRSLVAKFHADRDRYLYLASDSDLRRRRNWLVDDAPKAIEALGVAVCRQP